MDFGTLGAGRLGFHPSTWALPIRFWTGPSSARKVNALHRYWRQLHSPINKKDVWILLVWDLTIRTLVCSNPKWGDITSKHERNTFHDEFPRAFPQRTAIEALPQQGASAFVQEMCTEYRFWASGTIAPGIAPEAQVANHQDITGTAKTWCSLTMDITHWDRNKVRTIEII